MFPKSFKTFMATAVIAVGAAFAGAQSANAGSSFGIYVGTGGYNGIHYSSRAHRGHGYRKGYRHGPRHLRGGKCAPRRALNRAYRIGLNRPYIQRINGRSIAVKGWHRGYPAKVVFSQFGGCRVVATRGLY